MLKFKTGPSSDEREFVLSIPETAKTVGLNMGGGVDSSILLHMLTKYFPELHLKVFTIDKLNEPNHARRVIQALNLQDRVTHIIKEYVATNDDQAYGYMTRAVLQNGEVDFLFTGSNAVPAPWVLDERNFKPPRRKTENPRPNELGLPFLHLLKYHTIDLYYREGIEHILPLTHSCTEWDTGGDEVCWWCQERRWAFSVLNKTYIPGM